MFIVNRKLFFGLSPDPEGDLYACLVKKIKGSLVAVVVSNRDKDKIDIDAADNLYFHGNWDGRSWITPMKIAQKNSYPLLILTVAGEPIPIAVEEEAEPPAPTEEIESIGLDNNLPGETEGEPLFGAPSADETPEGGFLAPRDEAADIESAEDEEITEDELQFEPPGPMVNAIDDDLSDAREIETDELEERLDEDIRETFGEEDEYGRADAAIDTENAGDDLSDMFIAPKNEELNLDISDGPREPFGADDIESGGGDIFADTRIERPDTPAYRSPSQAGRAEPSFEDEEEAPHDFFGLYVHPIGGEMVEKVSEAIRSGEPPLQGREAAASRPRRGAGLPEDLEGPAREALETVISRVSRLEEMFSGDSGEAAGDEPAREERIGAVCLDLDEWRMTLAMEKPVEEGAFALILVDRPWIPPLRFHAVAEAESSRRSGDMSVTDFRFTAVSPEGREGITAYLSNRAESFKRLKDALND